MCEALPWEGGAMGLAKVACDERRLRWVGLVWKWRDSGASQAAFCRAQGLNANTFNFWKLRVLRQRPEARCNQRRSEAAADGGTKFIPVRVATPSPCAFEVCLRGGHSIRVASGFDEASLLRLIAVLEADDRVERAC
jgi:hypothetical protein